MNIYHTYFFRFIELEKYKPDFTNIVYIKSRFIKLTNTYRHDIKNLPGALIESYERLTVFSPLGNLI